VNSFDPSVNQFGNNSTFSYACAHVYIDSNRPREEHQRLATFPPAIRHVSLTMHPRGTFYKINPVSKWLIVDRVILAPHLDTGYLCANSTSEKSTQWA
jgi:hypothetical protein